MRADLASSPVGKVWLVGAGPGRADLLTLRGAALLSQADVVVLDALVDRRVLRHCRPGVRVIDAGKRGHGRVIMKQPAINALLVRWARAGRRVVRLKGGDPYVFGRGGEEAACLAEAGIPFEVVPGVSSVVAAPSFAGIPLTHRGLASTVTVVTGHEGRENPYLLESGPEHRRRTPPRVAWEKIPSDGTLVILMGLAKLPLIVDRLRAAGWRPSIPAAAVQWGATSAQRSVRGTLGTLVEDVRRHRLGPPAVIVVGPVVALAPTLNWWERLPLFGRTVWVTRAAEQAEDLCALLEERGARAVEAPLVETVPVPLTAAGRRALSRLEDFDGAIFTSANAVRFFVEQRGEKPWPLGVPVHAVGPKTAAALWAARIPVSTVAEVQRAEGVLKNLGTSLAGKHFLFPRAREGRDTVPAGLQARGARVTLLPLYRTRPRPLAAEFRKALREGAVDAVTFAAPSAVESLARALKPALCKKLFQKVRAVSLGPVTDAALRRFGVWPAATARETTVPALAEAVQRVFQEKKR